MRPVTTPPDSAKVPPLGGYVAKQCPVRAQLDLDANVDRSLRVETTAAERARMDAGREFEKRIFAVLSTVEGAEIIQAATRAEAHERRDRGGRARRGIGVRSFGDRSEGG